jgi:hypothetical protein
MEQIKAAIARQWLDKHTPTTACIHATAEDLLEAMFCMQSGLRVYSKDTGKFSQPLLGGGFEYLHCSPVKHRR